MVPAARLAALGRQLLREWRSHHLEQLDRLTAPTTSIAAQTSRSTPIRARTAIAEFKTLRGQYSAEYGRNASGQIDVVTKSGTNTIHGSAYEYLRNDALRCERLPEQLPRHTRIPKYRYNDFGFSFGGPVYIPKIYNGHNKTFFFVSEKWLREVTYTTGTAIVPTTAERGGDFSNVRIQRPEAPGRHGPMNVCTALHSTPPQARRLLVPRKGTKVTNISPTAQAYLKDVYSVIPAPQSAFDMAQ